MKKLLLITLLATTSTLGFAHGGAHPTTRAAQPAEQKPWGIAARADQVSRTIEISMSDTMRFTPDTIRIKLNESVRFVVKNTGGAMHEMVIGTREELEAHAALMQKFPDMEHDEPYMAHVSPKKSGEIIWQFNRPGTFEFACLIPGHFTAGMKGTIVVEAASATRATVRRIDAASRKITLQHETIEHLGMPPMTMVFSLGQGVSVADLKAGQNVRVVVEKVGTRYVVTQLERAE